MNETPVWQVDVWDLARDLSKIDQQWAYVQELLDDQDLFDLRDPEVSGWSCGEHAGHVAMVSNWIATEIEENLRDSQRDSEQEWGEHTEWILNGGDFPRGSAKSPPQFDPAGRPRAYFLTVFPAAVQSWISIGKKADILPACPARFPHFALGYMTSSEWVRFCALHTAHHLAVVRDVRARVA